jgi:hypothetical protein
MKRALAAELARIEHGTIDWEVRDGDVALGIRDREVRERVRGMLELFNEELDATVDLIMGRREWTRESLHAALSRRLGALPLAELLAAMPDRWIRHQRFRLSQRGARRIAVDHMVGHLVRSLASDYREGRLDERVAQRAGELLAWFRLVRSSELATHLDALRACVPRMLYVVHAGAATPMAAAAPRVDSPALRALLAAEVALVPQRYYDDLMRVGDTPQGPVAVHAQLADRRQYGSGDHMARLAEQLVGFYRADPAFDDRPRDAVVDAIVQEAHAATDHKARRYTVSSWILALDRRVAPETLAGVLGQ